MPDFEVCRRQRRMPVVRVNDVGAEPHVDAELQSGARQKAEAARVIEIIVIIGVVVQPGAPEIFLELDEKYRHSVMRRGLNGAPFFGIPHPDPHRRQERANVVALTINKTVERHDHNDIVTQGAQRLRQ
jgi:hypothetical protein